MRKRDEGENKKSRMRKGEKRVKIRRAEEIKQGGKERKG
jgi:hypothetical protein